MYFRYNLKKVYSKVKVNICKLSNNRRHTSAAFIIVIRNIAVIFCITRMNNDCKFENTIAIKLKEVESSFNLFLLSYICSIALVMSGFKSCKNLAR